MPPKRRSHRHKTGSRVVLTSVHEPIAPAAPASSPAPIVNFHVPGGRHYPGDDTLRPHNEVAVDQVYNKAKDIIKKVQGLSDIASVLSELPTLNADLMMIVNTVPGLLGPEKKVVVVRVLQRIVADMQLTDNQVIVDAAINYVIPGVIDLLILAADGKLDLGRKWRSTKKAWNTVMGLCCCCAKGKSACTCSESATMP